MTTAELYEVDFFEWTQRNAELLSQGRFESADLPHIAVELRDMGLSNRREVESYLRRLIMHLLKWQIQPSRRTKSWLSSIADSRVQLRDIFEQSPSLRRHAAESLVKVYPDARRLASIETGLAPKAFPIKCPHTFERLMDIDFLPGD